MGSVERDGEESGRQDAKVGATLLQLHQIE